MATGYLSHMDLREVVEPLETSVYPVTLYLDLSQSSTAQTPSLAVYG